MEDKLKLRVFRRTLNNIMIIWNLEGLEDTERDLDKLNIFLLDKNDKPIKVLNFRQLDPDDFKNLKPKKDQICGVIIPQKENVIDPFKKIKLKFSFNKTKEVELQIAAKGFMETFLKDNKEKAVFLYAYDVKNRAWRRVEGMEVDGKFCICLTNLTVKK